MDKRELVLQYIKDSTLSYWTNYKAYVIHIDAGDVANISFKHTPSLTYLNLFCDALPTVSRVPNLWERWRCYLDIRKETIYRLDLEDKNQCTRCSEFCYEILNFPLHKNWKLDYDGFPGYIRLHDMDKPKEFNFDGKSFRDDIIDFVSESSVVNDVMLKFLPSIHLLQGWIRSTDISIIYAFLSILYKKRSKDIAVIDTLLNYSKQFYFWRELEPEVVNWLLLTIQNMNLSCYQWLYKGTCCRTLALILRYDLSTFKAFLHHGLFPLKENSITIDRTSNDDIEKVFMYIYDRFIYLTLPEAYYERKRESLSTKLTNVDLLCLIAIRVYGMVENAEWEETLVMIWKCISNAYLVFEDFEQLFEGLSVAERDELRNIYEWYRKAINTAITYDRSPRTLLQYCRCTVRKSLVETSKLQSGIGKLPLPELLKSFLKLE